MERLDEELIERSGTCNAIGNKTSVQNKIDGKGKDFDFRTRCIEHRNSLTADKHDNSHERDPLGSAADHVVPGIVKSPFKTIKES